MRREWGGRLPIALVFPNKYSVGMSSLAVHTLYRLWNERDDTVCERVFSDLSPPISLETGVPLAHFPIVAFTLAYELDYFGAVSILRQAGVPLRTAHRDETHPLVIAGGPAISANPEPLAPLLDAVFVGEIEPVVDRLTEALQRIGDGRDKASTALLKVPGVYVPGRPAEGPPSLPVRRQWLANLDDHPTHSVLLTPHTEFADMALIEIARGCGHGCRFCLAGYAYRPARQRSPESILDQARALLQHTRRLGLVSAAVSDHSDIDDISVALRRLGARISVSSLRADRLTEPLVRALVESGARTLTIAPEAGSERLRQVIHKGQTEDDILRAIDLAGRFDMARVKLYFMIGLPTEEEADLKAMVDLVAACTRRFPRQLAVSITPFVPKAHTPFQRARQLSAPEIAARSSYVERELRRLGVFTKAESPLWAEVQGTLARGDRRVFEALLASDRPTPARWSRALCEAGLSAEELLANRPAAEPLPWSFVRFGEPPTSCEAAF